MVDCLVRVLGRRVAELELYILVCKVCVVGVFMRNVSLSDPFKYFSRTLDLVFRTTIACARLSDSIVETY